MFHRCLLHVIHDVLVPDEFVYVYCRVDSVIAIVICAESFLFEIKLFLIGSVPGIAADHGPVVQLVDLGRGE